MEAPQLPCPAFCPAEPPRCFYLEWGHQVAEKLRAAQTVATPTPLMDVRLTTPPRPSQASRMGIALENRRLRQRLEVLHRIDIRLRIARREVDAQQRRTTGQGMRQPIQHQQTQESPTRQEAPDVLDHVPLRTAETQTEMSDVTEEPLTYVTDSKGDDGGNIMEQSMEQWMEAQHSVGDQLHPAVQDELYHDALDSAGWERPARMERSKSSPPTWD